MNINNEIKLTKKELEKRNKVSEFLSKLWEVIETDTPRYSELVKIGDWKSPEYNVWSYKLDEAQKSNGIKELNLWVGFEPAEEGKANYDLKLMSEKEDKTIQEYLLIYRGGRLSILDNEIGGCALYNRINRARQEYLNDLAEQKEQEDLKTLGYEAYVNKKLAEDKRLQVKNILKENGEEDEEIKERNEFHEKIARELLAKYQWNVGDWIKGLYDELKQIEEANKQKSKYYEYFNDRMVRDIVEKIVERHWNIHSKSIWETVNDLHGSDKYRSLTNKYRDRNNFSIREYCDELGADIQQAHSSLGYSIKELGDYFGEGFLKREIISLINKEEKERENWNEQQWKDYYPRKSYGEYEEIGVRELSNYDIEKFLNDTYKYEDFQKDNVGKYPEDEEGWKKSYRDYRKEIINRVKSVKEDIFEGKNFDYSCNYCSEQNKNPSKYKLYRLVARTKHNIIYTCSRCKNTEYYINIIRWEKATKMNEKDNG